MRALGGVWVGVVVALLGWGCTKSVSEPKLQSIAPPVFEPDARVLAGFADLHNHQFNQLGYGGVGIWGSATEPPAQGLPDCRWRHWFGIAAMEKYNPARCGTYAGHGTSGNDAYDGWPRWDTYVHQQVYASWLRRAYLGGLRLMVMQAGHSRETCHLLLGGHDCDNDMLFVDAELDAARRFELQVDQEAGWTGSTDLAPVYRGERPGWYRIVYSPQQAYETIAQGKLAVVLGVEVQYLLGCEAGQTCTYTKVDEGLDDLYRKGVRHVFPIHNALNAYGAPSIFNDGQAYNFGINVGPDRDCESEGYLYRRRSTLCTFPQGIRCSRDGLTALGKYLVEGLLTRGMIIDVDHMGQRSRNGTFDIAERRELPVVSGHSDFFETSVGEGRNEQAWKAEELERIRKVGGLIAPIINPGNTSPWPGQRPIDDAHPTEPSLSRACTWGVEWGSSTEWSWSYQFARSVMQGPVALGTDFNGFLLLPHPRFGPDGCFPDAQKAVLGATTYPFRPQVPAPTGAPRCGQPGVDRCACVTADGRLERCVFGNRTFDVTTDGLPHVGLLPDFLEDVRAQYEARYRELGQAPEQAAAFSRGDLEPLFQSADAYVRLWARLEARGPATKPPRLPAALSLAKIEPRDRRLPVRPESAVRSTLDAAPVLEVPLDGGCHEVTITASLVGETRAPRGWTVDRLGGGHPLFSVTDGGVLQTTLPRSRDDLLVRFEPPEGWTCAGDGGCAPALTFVAKLSAPLPVSAEVCDGADNDCNGLVDDCDGPGCVDTDGDGKKDCVDEDDDDDCVLDEKDNCPLVANANASCPQADSAHACSRCGPLKLGTAGDVLAQWFQTCASNPATPSCRGRRCPVDQVFPAEHSAEVLELLRDAQLTAVPAPLRPTGTTLNLSAAPRAWGACEWSPAVEQAVFVWRQKRVQLEACLRREAELVDAGACQAAEACR